MRGDIMDTKNRCAPVDAVEPGGKRPDKTILHGLARHASDKGLPGDSDQDRTLGIDEHIQVREHTEILIIRLGKADTRIKQDVRAGNAGAVGHVEGAPEELRHVLAEVYVAIRFTAIVRDADKAFSLGHGVGHALILGHAPDIIHKHRARLGSAPGDLGLIGVDGERQGVRPGKACNGLTHAGPFVFEAHRITSGPCRLTANVENVCAVLGHLPGMRLRSEQGVMRAPIGKRVRGHIQDAHDQRRRGREPLQQPVSNRYPREPVHKRILSAWQR